MVVVWCLARWGEYGLMCRHQPGHSTKAILWLNSLR
jgi:hypothetical protein